jgi:hypothetical protein
MSVIRPKAAAPVDRHRGSYPALRQLQQQQMMLQFMGTVLRNIH